MLAIDLLFLPWLSFSYGPFSASLSATDAPDGWLGVLAVLATLAAVADLGIERLAPQIQLPSVRGGRTQTRLLLAGLAALSVGLKFLLHVHFSLFGIGVWAGVVLAAALVVLARRSRDTGAAV